MKKILLASGVLVALSSMAFAGSFRSENSDSKKHTVQLKCSGSSKTIELPGSTTTTVTFHSTSKACDIVGGTVTWPVKVLEDGSKWKFKDGKAIKN